MRTGLDSNFTDSERLPTTLEEAEELAVLWGICHAFGSTSDVDKIVPATVDWARKALATPDAGVRLSLHRDDRLEVVGSDGMDALAGGSASGAERRGSVFTSKQPDVSELGDHETSFALLPLVSRGVAVGVLEVVAPTERVRRRWHTLEAVASQVAILIMNLTNQTLLNQEIKTLEGSVDLVRELLQAGTPQEAVHKAVALLHDPYRISAAAWFYSDSEGRFDLLATKGISAEAERDLDQLEEIPSLDDEMSTAQADELIGHFKQAAGTSEVEALVSDRVVLLAGVDDDRQASGLRTVSGLMFETLKNLSHVKLAETRNQTLDSAIGFAAHELKGPLTTTKLLIDTLRATKSVERLMPALERSSAELSELWSLVEMLLEWSVGQPRLELREVPALELIVRAVDAAGTDGSCTVDARVSSDLTMAADDRHLSMALSSLLKSALKHGTPHPVEVTVFREDDSLVTRIKDRGPPIPRGTEDAIFDPFLKDSSSAHRVSKGLGLFVARKIVEAHGGKIVSEPSSEGASLRVQLPLETGAAF